MEGEREKGSERKRKESGVVKVEEGGGEGGRGGW